MDIEMIAIVSGIIFGGGLIVAKILIGRHLALAAERAKRD